MPNTFRDFYLIGCSGDQLVINADGSINVVATTGQAALTPTESVVSVNTGSTAILAANANRKGAIVQNHGASVLGLSFFTGTTFANCAIKIPQYASIDLAQFGGVIRLGVWGRRASATEDAGAVDEV